MSCSILYRQKWRSYARRELRGGECLFVLNIGGDPVPMLYSRLDFDVKGTAEHVTVIDADGHSYEFSYSFWEEREMDWTNNRTITLPVWYHLWDGYPVGVEDETSWFSWGPIVDLDAGWNIDNHNGHFHFYMPFLEITGLTVSWDSDESVFQNPAPKIWSASAMK